METQCNNRTKVFNKFITNISHLITPQVLKLFHDKYYIKEFKIGQIDEAVVKNIYAGIVLRSKRGLASKNELNWLQNELRIFVWTLVYYGQFQQIEIQNFTESDWEFFLTLFPNKRMILFQYQAYNLLKNHNQYKKWSQQQDKLFEQLVKNDEYRLRWSDLGKTLFIESDRKYFRTPKQCRERQLNHLDPSKMKKSWHEQEDFLLIEHVKYFGKKWANISKKLQNRRNEHSIKNRFKSLMTKESKLFSGTTDEKELIDSVYNRMLQNKTKHHNERQESLQIQQNQQCPTKQYKQQENYDFESQRPPESIFDYCDHSQLFQKQKHSSTELLCNMALNNSQNQHELKISNKQNLPQKHIFEFSKISNYETKYNENYNKLAQQQNETQKRVRADLFLQEDPFQMLKSYFYKHSSLQ